MAERRKTSEAQLTVPKTIKSISVHQGRSEGTMGSATVGGWRGGGWTREGEEIWREDKEERSAFNSSDGRKETHLVERPNTFAAFLQLRNAEQRR